MRHHKERKVLKGQFLYLIMNYPHLRVKDYQRIFDIKSSSAAYHVRNFKKGEYDDIKPDDTIEEEARSYSETYYPAETPSRVALATLKGIREFIETGEQPTVAPVAEPAVEPAVEHTIRYREPEGESGCDPIVTKKPSEVELTLQGIDVETIQDYIKLTLGKLDTDRIYKFSLCIRDISPQ